jgi:uncharacterized protein YndB with AHSA1/START domain
VGPLTATVEIDASRDQVFEFVSDLANRPAYWGNFVSELRLERLQSRGIGAAARFRIDAPGARFWMETVIDELDPPHRVSEHGSGGRNNRVPVFIVHELVETSAGLTSVSLSFWTEPSHRLDRFKESLGVSVWYRMQLRRAVRRLRQVVEEGEEGTLRVGVGGEDRPSTGVA